MFKFIKISIKYTLILCFLAGVLVGFIIAFLFDKKSHVHEIRLEPEWLFYDEKEARSDD